MTTRRRPTPWAVFLVWGLVLLVAYRLGPSLGLPDGARSVVYWLAIVSCVIGLLVGVRLHRPSSMWPWTLLAAGQLMGLSGDFAFYGADLVGVTLPYPSGADILYLLDYPLSCAGLLILIRRRTPGWDLASLIDAGIITVSAALLSWIFLVSPSISGDELTTAGRLVSAAYPMGDVLLLSVGSRLLLGAGKRPPALWMLAGYLALVLIPDALYGVQTLAGTYHEGGWLETLWMSAALLLGLAGLHPSMSAVDERSPVAAPDSGAGRLSVLTVASLLAPGTLMAQYFRGAPLHVPLTSVACALLFLLVLSRMAGLVSVQRRVAITDGLTGLHTRRYFETVLATMSRRVGPGLSVLLLDVDHFKLVNDTYGHQGGDRVLCELARRLTHAVRPGDTVARYGGEEFAIVLPHTTPAEARRVADRVHRAVRGAPIVVNPAVGVTVTVSLGVATMPADAHDADELVLLADELLYTAKETGRDRVVAGSGIGARSRDVGAVVSAPRPARADRENSATPSHSASVAGGQ